MNNKLAHLELIEAVITRMGSNSFLLKGWSVTLVAALFALAASNSNAKFVLIAYLPALVLWGLDGFFLWQETLFRGLYDKVRVITDDSRVDFSMDTTPVRDRGTWLGRTFSKTLLPFHGCIVLTIVIVTLLALRQL